VDDVLLVELADALGELRIRVQDGHQPKP
jgi:hypothetical protein